MCTALESRHTKSVCMPSSQLMSLFKKVRLGIKPHFSQKMDTNELKKIPLTAACLGRLDFV